MKLFHYDSLKVRISVTAGLSILILVCAVAAFSYWFAKSELVSAYKQQMGNLAVTTASWLENDIHMNLKRAEDIAGSDPLILALASNDYASLSSILSYHSENYATTENVFISSPDADTQIIVDGIGGKSIGQKWRNEFERNVDLALDGKSTASPLGVSPVTGKSVLIATVPVKVGEQVIAILGYAIDFQMLCRNITKDIRIGITGYVAVSQMDGLIIKHNDESSELRINLNDYEWGKTILNAKSGATITYNYNGDAKLAYIERNDEFGYTICATMKYSDIKAQIAPMALKIILSGMIGLCLIAGILFWQIDRQLQPIDQVVSVAERMATGDLNTDIHKTGVQEIRRLLSAFRTMSDKLRETILTIQETSRFVQLSSNAVNQAAANISGQSGSQSAGIEEISASSEEMTALVQSTSESAAHTDQIAKMMKAKALKGVEAVTKTVDDMKQIAEKIKAVSEIAQKTEMIALNAAIEAARAGAYGKGFAVVAGEVRKLAEQSNHEAEEINQIVNSSVAAATETGEQINAVIPAIQKTAQLVAEISAASLQQISGSSQINQTLSQFEASVQKNAASSEELALMSNDLSQKAEGLVSTVDFFKTSDNDHTLELYESSLTEKSDLQMNLDKGSQEYA